MMNDEASENKPRVLFVIPPSVGDYFSAQVPHIGIGYLTAILKKNSIDTKLIDMRLDYGIEKIFAAIDDFKPDIVGFSLFSMGFAEAKNIIEAVKKYKSTCKVILGGPHVSAVRKEVMKETDADMAVKGEGEFTLLEICAGKSPAAIEGLIWRDDGKIIENPDRPLIEDLDSLPIPDYSDFEMERYLTYPERHLPIVTSRGCPYQCIYCSVRLSMGMKFRARSPKNVVDEIEYWNKQGWISFEIHDDNFTLDIERAMKICDMIMERGIKITWKIDNGIRADRVSRELLQKMKDAGCTLIAFGVESGRESVLKAIKKSLDLSKVEESAKMAKEAGLTVGATFIIGHPTETYEDFMASLELAKKLPVDQVVFYNMVPYPGTELFGWIEQNGRFLMDKKTYLQEVAHWKNRPIFETDTFPEELRKKAYKKAYSLHRKKLLEFKLGKKLGYLAWAVTSVGFIDRMGHKLFLSPGLGRTIFNKLKKA